MSATSPAPPSSRVDESGLAPARLGSAPRRSGAAPARDKRAILEKQGSPARSGGLGRGGAKEEARPGGLCSGKVPRKRRRRGSPVPIEAATSESEESSTARSSRRLAQLRMEPKQSNVGDGSQDPSPGGNNFPYTWIPYMYGYQGPPSWFPQGLPQLPPNASMMHPSSSGPQVFHPAENANASAQNDEEDAEERPVSEAPTGKEKRAKVVSRIKLSNFSPDEDVNIVKSWLELSCDPITSTGQKKDSMWLRILERYNLRRGSYPERSVRSLQSRWDIIKAQVVKFSSFYADVNRENPSGMSDADKTTLAASIFAGVLKHNFGYLHCWEIMKDEPKWQDRKARAFAKSAGCDGSGEDTINLVNDNYSPTGSAENANASAQNDEEDAEERPVSAAPTGKEKRTKVVSRTKLSNFIPEEDVNIVKSWLEIRCDPIISTGQKKDRMWLRILERYNFRRGSCPERSVRSLQCRWDTIKAQVGEFSSFYVDVNRENPTGMSDADKTTHAASNFASVLKRNFGYLHCWEIMKDEPKWQDRKARAFAKSAGGDGFGEDTINLVNDNSSPIGSAENANASAQNDEEDAEERPVSAASTGKEKRTKVVSRTKLSNFIPEEDVNIVKSWLEISCDPITSTGQKKDGMWLRILERYNLRRGSCPERSVRSLQSRWDTIKAQVGKFSSFYADVNRENPSGMSDADKTTHAASIFAGVLKHNFGYLHCWEIMKDEPKWQDRKAGAFAKSAGGDGFGEDTINLVNDNSSPTGSAEKRPMGRDSSKAAKKKANSSAGSASSSEYASRMQDLSSQKISILQEESVRKNDHFQQLACIDEKRFEAMRSYNQSLLLIEQEKIQLMREKHDMDKAEKEKKEDERILGIDLDACTSAQRVYYETLQEEILEKIAARRRKRRGP